MDINKALNQYFAIHSPSEVLKPATPPTPSKPTIKVMLRDVYGEEKVYPACPQSEIFAQLAKQKTLTYQQINLIKDLGFVVEIVNARQQQYL
jgi:hypothetical protein